MKSFLFVLIISLSVLSGFFSATLSRTWYITPDGTGDAPTIQAGVDSSAAGDTVLVAKGTYSDSVQVTIEGSLTWVNVYLYKNITLLARSNLNALIDGPRDGVSVYAEGIDATAVIEGFRIRTTFGAYGCILPARSVSPLWGAGTGILCRSAPVRIIRNEIVDHSYAVKLIDSPALIEGNHIHRSSYGIDCRESSDALIHYNRIHGCAELIMVMDSSPSIINNLLYADIPYETVCGGISCYNSSAYIAHNDIISMNNSGISAGAGSVIEYNRFINHWTAAYVSGANPPVTVRYNLFYKCGTGIEQRGQGHPIIEKNTFDRCGTAMFGGDYVFRNNIITRSGNGLYLVGTEAIVECNNLYDISNRKYGGGDRTGMDGNISADPQYCGIPDSDNYFLQSDSPCAPGNHPDLVDCGLIGAFEVRCGTVPAGKFTWGLLKALFDNTERDSTQEVD